MKTLALCLSLISVVLMMAPPAFGYVPEPIFGVSWTPDGCYGPYNIYRCLDLYQYVVGQSNAAIDYALDPDPLGLFGCITNQCIIDTYSNQMAQVESQACTFNFSGGNDEMDSWCVALFNVIEDSVVEVYGGSGGGGGNF